MYTDEFNGLSSHPVQVHKLAMPHTLCIKKTTSFRSIALKPIVHASENVQRQYSMTGTPIAFNLIWLFWTRSIYT